MTENTVVVPFGFSIALDQLRQHKAVRRAAWLPGGYLRLEDRVFWLYEWGTFVPFAFSTYDILAEDWQHCPDPELAGRG